MTNEIFTQYGDNPITLCNNWLIEAQEHEPNDPETACLATANAQGRPSNRMILLKEIDARGFKFHTNENSQKGQDIASNPHAALCLYWKSLRKQIRIEGHIEQTSEEETNHYFDTRSIERKIGAWASNQSQPFDKREDLENAIEKYTKEFSGKDNIPRPPYWKGYRLIPQKIEFWIASKDRLHERFAYTRAEDKEWSATWLCP